MDSHIAHPYWIFMLSWISSLISRLILIQVENASSVILYQFRVRKLLLSGLLRCSFKSKSHCRNIYILIVCDKNCSNNFINLLSTQYITGLVFSYALSIPYQEVFGCKTKISRIFKSISFAGFYYLCFERNIRLKADLSGSNRIKYYILILERYNCNRFSALLKSKTGSSRNFGYIGSIFAEEIAFTVKENIFSSRNGRTVKLHIRYFVVRYHIDVVNIQKLIGSVNSFL